MTAAAPLARIAPAVFVVLWSTGFITAKFAAPVAGPFSLLTLRFALVVPILAAAVMLLGRPWPTAPQVLRAILAGMLIHGVYLGGIFLAVEHGLPAGVSGLVVGLQPILTAFFAAGLVGERVGLRHGVALVVGFAGVVLILAPKIGTIDGFPAWTGIVALGAVASIALGTVWQKRGGTGGDLVATTALQFVGATLVVLPGAVYEGFDYVWSLQLLAVVSWLVFVLSIGAVMLLLAMVRAGAVARVATLFYLVPPVTAFFAFLLFGETLTLVQLAGTVLVVTAVMVATRG